jgi:predicted exporter
MCNFPFLNHLFGAAWVLIVKIKVVTRRCRDRPSESIAIFKSVFVSISAVSLVSTFAVFPLLGFSVNTLSLLGLVLAIGLVVDDAMW